MQKNVKSRIILIDGVKYYSDRPETCRSCFFWKNRKVPCILGKENCYYLAEIIQSEQQKKCEGCCYASGRSCVSATCYKDMMAQFNAEKNRNRKKVPQMAKHDNRFRHFERMAKSAKRDLSGDKPGGCSRCLYFRPDFKYRVCQFTKCPYDLKENVFRSKPLNRDKFSGKGGA